MTARRALFLLLGAGLAAPLALSPYDLSLVGRFLALGILGMGLALAWGRAGALSLGHGVFFGLGGYAVAMHLKLAVGDGLPDFMLWNGVEALPWWWKPFASAAFAVVMSVAAPAALAAAAGWFVFRRGVSGVYFALLTQAAALAFSTLLISQQGLTGGCNGLTNFQQAFGFPLAAPHTQLGLYYATLAAAAGAFLALRMLERTWFGKTLLALRGKERRTQFLGYDTAGIKAAALGVSGGLAGLAGALFTLHAGVISPAMVGVTPSIEMVVWVALGGRDSLLGALLGTLGGNLLRDRLSSAFPDVWLLLLGGVFLFVTLAAPRGLAGLASDAWRRLRSGRERPAPLPQAAEASDG